MATAQEAQSEKISNERRRSGPLIEIGIKSQWLDPLSAWSILAFVVLVLLWTVFRTLPEPNPRWFRRISRVSAYLAALAFLVPYVHIARRSFRYRYWGKMATWTRWHIATAYAGFGLAIIHSRARSNNELTLAIQAVLWTVVISGIIGFYGQKLIYRLLAWLVKEELGLERLEPERQRLIERGKSLIQTMPAIVAEDVVEGKWPLLRARLEELGTEWKRRLELLQTTEGTQAASEQTSEQDRQTLLRAIDSLLPPKKPDPKKQRIDQAEVPAGILAGEASMAEQSQLAGETQQKEQDGILAAMNNLIQANGFYDQFKTGDHTLPSWLNASNGQKSDPVQGSPSETRVLNHWLLGELLTTEVLSPASTRSMAIEGFVSRVLADSLEPAFASWSWLFSRRALEPVSKNHYLRVRGMCGPTQQAILDEFWELVQTRRQMDLEYWMHRLGRVWLLVHGPASWALLVLVVFHIWQSVRYGGY